MRFYGRRWDVRLLDDETSLICSILERISIPVDLAETIFREDFETLEKQRIMIECHSKVYRIFRLSISIIVIR